MPMQRPQRMNLRPTGQPVGCTQYILHNIVVYQFHCVGARPQDTFLIKYTLYFHLNLFPFAFSCRFCLTSIPQSNRRIQLIVYWCLFESIAFTCQTKCGLLFTHSLIVCFCSSSPILSCALSALFTLSLNSAQQMLCCDIEWVCCALIVAYNFTAHALRFGGRLAYRLRFNAHFINFQTFLLLLLFRSIATFPRSLRCKQNYQMFQV